MKFVTKIIIALLVSSTSAAPLKVAVIGDGMTLGFKITSKINGVTKGVPIPEFNWPTVLGKKLDKDGNKLFEVIVGASSGSAI
jgi:hypothetical protein